MNGDALTLLFVGAGIYFARNSRTTSTSKKRGPLYLIVLGACIAGCNSQNTTSVDPILMNVAKGYVGKSYKNKYSTIALFCKRPDLPINQEGDCIAVSDTERVTVTDAVQYNGEIFMKLHLDDGRDGYVMNDQFLLLDRFSRPSPRIGMTDAEAYTTNWGYPDKENVTETAGHRLKQLVFPGTGYLYVEDGRLTTIQRIE